MSKDEMAASDVRSLARAGAGSGSAGDSAEVGRGPHGEVLYAAIEALKGKIEDKQAFIKALRGVRVDTLRGPIAFDEYGNVIGNIYIRKVEKKDGRLVNSNIYTYSNVSQFWNYDPKEFLKQPVYSRDWPPMKSAT